MSVEPNPFKWSVNLKTLVGLLAVIGSIWGGAKLGTDAIYHFAEVQTNIMNQLVGLKGQLVDQKAEMANQGAHNEHSLDVLENKITPRIDKLEIAVHSAESEASAAKARADDMKEDLHELKDIATRTFDVTQSNNADIKATRRAVAPKPGDHPAIP